MPIYIYKCPKCGYTAEVRLPIEHTAPTCGSGFDVVEGDHDTVKMEKQLTAARFRIDAGHAWYKRDENGSPPFDGIGKF